ncbi:MULTISPECIES: diguanylate cyclase [unclassified Sphingomonas]|uniref:diguanylate cyclase n=1 Tax=unclassified Sphingomonas TaxID=196159 RepID=UPI001F58EE50|nr:MULTISPECIES: diguanylate cyclase [unclassified Sphingomonas]
MKQRPTDQREMYVLSDARHDRRAASGAVVLDDLAHLAMRSLDVPLAVIVIDRIAQGWQTKRVGAASITPVSGQAQHSLGALVNPVAAGAAGFPFYVAVPLRDDRGARIGTLAILAEETRTVSDDDLATLRKLAGIIELIV